MPILLEHISVGVISTSQFFAHGAPKHLSDARIKDREINLNTTGTGKVTSVTAEQEVYIVNPQSGN